MASDTFATRLIADIYAGPSGVDVVKSKLYGVGESGIYPGYAVRVSTDDKVYLAKESDKKFSGVVALMPGQEIDTAYTTSQFVEIYPAGSGMVVWMYKLYASPLAPVLPGDKAVLSTTDGMVTIFTYADGTDYDDSYLNSVGVFEEYNAGHLTENKLIKVRLN
jgi:hypothetical protein